jgi:hypothetical protein
MAYRDCDGIGRRDFLKVGALGAGLTLGQYLRLADAGEINDSAGRSGILVFLKGGPSHQDMFDMKPNAAAEYRGEFRPVRTNVPGVEICEHMPRLAQCADKYAILRGVSHNLAAHDLGTRYLLTGNRPIPLLKYPVYGAVVSKESPARPDVPPHVAIDEDLEGPGFLGTQYGALATGEKPRYGQPFSVRGITLEDGMTITQLERRRRLAEDVDVAFRGFESLDQQVTGVDRLSQRAYQIISSRRTRDAFDLSLESPTIANRFGKHEFGQSFLLASRLIEAGVRFVTILLDGWDTHNDNFKELKDKLLPGLDEGLAAMLRTLDDKGLLDSTAVMVTGEFGRTPKVNGTRGRDHWARAMFSLMAGGGVRGGQAIGASNETAAEPAGDGFTPDDVAASFYQNLGIDPQKEYHSNTGRPITLVREGHAIRDLFAG